MTLGSFVGIAMFTEAVDEERLPASATLAELAAPTAPFTVTVTVVPTGMLAPAMVTATGPVVPAGSVMSGVVSEPSGLAGALTPATDAMRSVGVFGRAATVG